MGLREGHLRCYPLGDTALVVELGTAIDEATHLRVREAEDVLAGTSIPGVGEMVPGYATLTLFYDPQQVVGAGAPPDGVVGWIEKRVEAVLRRRRLSFGSPTERWVEIPVCYGGEFGPDLGAVATHAGLSEAEVVKRHSGGAYRVYVLGFAPGFAYMGGLPTELATPRHETPRARVEPGSVGIAGAQTGVYPLPTPGGWQIIGRTPLALFRPQETPPTLLKPGDRVRFRTIQANEFEALAGRLG
jgi:inhibitor of KinA